MAAIKDTDALRALYGVARERSVKKQMPKLDRYAKQFVALSPFCLLATHDALGRADVSPRGDDPGFVQLEGDHTLLIPDWPGNNRLDSLSNIVQNGRVGLLFLVPGIDETLRVNGTAQIFDDLELRQQFAAHERLPLTVLKVQAEEVYLHCAKALMRSKLWDAQRQVERSVLPSMGEMLKEQTNWDSAETQAEMLERYKKTLY